MTTLEVARIAEARMTAKGWSARCPAHVDRLPSLSICEGRGGRTLLRCFAGCSADAVAQALGLKMTDLFVDDRRSDDYRRQAPRQVSADDVEAELKLELARIRARESAESGFDVPELARLRNEARAIVERRLSVRLQRKPVPWYEIEPHCADPAWVACVDAALVVVAARASLTGDELRTKIDSLPATQDRILRLARRFQRDLVRPFVQTEAA
jgi:hypothetical protein